jgi:hypothetical protein
MSNISQDVFLADTKTKIRQYLYRSLEGSFDPMVVLLQDISGVGPLNWFTQSNKIRLQRVFTNLNTAVGLYDMTCGDFRSYILLKYVDILYDEFKDELFKIYVQSSYNVLPETVVGNLDTVTSLAPPQTTSFPGLPNTAAEFNPINRTLIPKSLYDSTM